MIICICHRISDRDISRAVHEGCSSFDQLQDDTRIATACGACHDCAHQSFHAQAAAGPGGPAETAHHAARRNLPVQAQHPHHAQHPPRVLCSAAA